MTRTPSDPGDLPVRKPYATPELRVYGTVAAITAALSMTGTLKDGGPNNLKT